jgi:hypothetical protein
MKKRGLESETAIARVATKIVKFLSAPAVSDEPRLLMQKANNEVFFQISLDNANNETLFVKADDLKHNGIDVDYMIEHPEQKLNCGMFGCVYALDQDRVLKLGKVDKYEFRAARKASDETIGPPILGSFPVELWKIDADGQRTSQGSTIAYIMQRLHGDLYELERDGKLTDDHVDAMIHLCDQCLQSKSKVHADFHHGNVLYYVHEDGHCVFYLTDWGMYAEADGEEHKENDKYMTMLRLLGILRQINSDQGSALVEMTKHISGSSRERLQAYITEKYSEYMRLLAYEFEEPNFILYTEGYEYTLPFDTFLI